MHQRSSVAILALALVVPAAALVLLFVLNRGEQAAGTAGTVRDDENAAPAKRPGFEDILPKSGIDFRMRQQSAEQFKVNLYDHGCGVAVADYDGDGDDDVLFLKQLGENGLYRNRGDGTFEKATAEAGPLALADRICVGAAFADYDNDGDQDLYITSTRGGNVFFRNEGGGRFTDVSQQAGVGLVAHSQTPAFFDYDNDGYLDLFVTNTARWTLEDYDDVGRYYPGAGTIWTHVFKPEDREFNVLYHNNRDGTFTDVTAETGLSGRGWSGDVAVFDFDEDGWLDLLVTNMFGSSQLYRNDGQGHFQDLAADSLGRTSMGSIGAKAFDFNNDGHLDLFVTDMHSDMWVGFYDSALVQPAQKFTSVAGPDLVQETDQQRYMRKLESQFRDTLGFDPADVIYGNNLFRNDGDGKFTEVSDQAGMETFWPWGIAIGDFDNDGNEDAFIASGMGFPFFYWPNCLMMNNGDGTFTDRAAENGIEPPREGKNLPDRVKGQDAPRSSRCVAAGDFDGDGRLDLMVNNFNDRPYYFKNSFSQRHYVALRLRGVRSNRDAIGAVVHLQAGQKSLTRQVHCSGGYLSQSSKTLHFGLGDTDKIDRIEIRWPSGTRQTLDSIEIDGLHEITEPDEQ